MGKLYVYSTNTLKNYRTIHTPEGDVVYKPWFKIGMTEQASVEMRVKQQDGTSNPEKLTPQIIFDKNEFDLSSYGISAYDAEHQIHEYFKERGREVRLDASREWFECTMDEIRDAIKYIIDPNAHKKRMVPMPHQGYNDIIFDDGILYNGALKFIEKRFDSGSRNILLNHKPRSGKTYITYQHLIDYGNKIGYKNVLLLTNFPVLNGQWKNDALNIYGFNYDIINVCEETINDVIMFDDKPNFVMISLQDAKGGPLASISNIPMLKEKFKLLREIKWDLIIIDEVHRGKETEQTDKLLGHLNYDRLLGLTATPTKNLLRGTFAPEDIHTYSMVDEKKFKKLYPELYTLPDISFYLYNPSIIIKDQMQYYKEEDFFNWNKFLQVENGRLKYKNDIEIFFKWIAGFYGNNINMPLKKLNSNSILMFVQNNECQPLLVDLLNSIDFYRNNYNIHYTNSKVNSNSSDLLRKTKNVYIPRDDKKCIVIANRQLTTGITLRNCDMVMFMNDWASIDEYIQASYRCQSAMRDKTNCSVIDFTPYRTFKIFKEFIEVNYISGNKSLEERYVEFFDSLSIFECNEDGKFKNIDLEGFKNRLVDVMDISSKNYFNETLIKKDLINDNIDSLLSFGEIDSDVDRSSEDVRLDDNEINKGKTKIIEKTFKSKKDIKEEENRYKIALENAKYILNKTLFMSLFTGCKIDDINSILSELENNEEIQKYYIDSLIGIDNIKFSDVVFIYKTMFDESLINDRIRTFNTKIRNLIYTKNNHERVINIEKVIDLINSYIGVSNVEKKLLGEVFTPFALIEEMLDTLPIEVWSNPDLKWLDPANGIGNFPIIVVKRLMKGLETWQPDEELRYKHILENMIYVCDIQSKNMFIYLMLFDPNNEYKMNWYRGSFLDEGFDNWMKEKNIESFDVIMGNPPYQDGTSNKKRSLGAKKNLYQKFIKSGLEKLNNDGMLIFINPVGFLKMTDCNNLNEITKKIINLQLIYVKLHVQNYFNNANPGELCYFLIKNNNHKILTKIHDDKIYNIPFYEYKFIPTTIREETMNIFFKLMNNDGSNLNLKREVKVDELSNKKFITIKMMNNRLTNLKSISHINIDNYNSKSNLSMITENPDNLSSILNSKIFSFINKSYNFDAILYHKFYNQFKIPTDHKSWTNEELYKYYGLTNKEVDLIENLIK